MQPRSLGGVVTLLNQWSSAGQGEQAVCELNKHSEPRRDMSLKVTNYMRAQIGKSTS